MKIRNGFVSNSSSSSFLIMYKEKIEGQEAAVKYLKDHPSVYPVGLYYERSDYGTIDYFILDTIWDVEQVLREIDADTTGQISFDGLITAPKDYWGEETLEFSIAPEDAGKHVEISTGYGEHDIAYHSDEDGIDYIIARLQHENDNERW